MTFVSRAPRAGKLPSSNCKSSGSGSSPSARRGWYFPITKSRSNEIHSSYMLIYTCFKFKYFRSMYKVIICSYRWQDGAKPGSDLMPPNQIAKEHVFPHYIIGCFPNSVKGFACSECVFVDVAFAVVAASRQEVNMLPRSNRRAEMTHWKNVESWCKECPWICCQVLVLIGAWIAVLEMRQSCFVWVVWWNNVETMVKHEKCLTIDSIDIFWQKGTKRAIPVVFSICPFWDMYST